MRPLSSFAFLPYPTEPTVRYASADISAGGWHYNGVLRGGSPDPPRACVFWQERATSCAVGRDQCLSERVGCGFEARSTGLRPAKRGSSPGPLGRGGEKVRPLFSFQPASAGVWLLGQPAHTRPQTVAAATLKKERRAPVSPRAPRPRRSGLYAASRREGGWKPPPAIAPRRGQGHASSGLWTARRPPFFLLSSVGAPEGRLKCRAPTVQPP